MPLIKGTPEEGHWALFDLDWTLIRPVKTIYYENGWTWLPERENTLIQVEEKGYRIGIITNQKPWMKNSLPSINERCNEVFTRLKFILKREPIILAAYDEVEYRKPAIGWMNILKCLPGSFYCGDAAGRPQDFSNADIKFAENARLPFYLPEQLFPITNIPSQVYTLPRVFVLLVGVQGSGKTTFAGKLELNNWLRVSSDEFKSNASKITKELTNKFTTGMSVVYDATNPTISGRKKYISLAQTHGYTVCIVHLINPGGWNKSEFRSTVAPAVAVRVYWSRLEPPSFDMDHVPVYELL